MTRGACVELVPARARAAASRNRLRLVVTLCVATYGQAGLAMIAHALVAKRLGSSGFGAYGLALAIGGIVAVAVNFGADRTLVRDLAHASDPRAALVSAGLARLLLAGPVVCAIAALAALTTPASPIVIAAACAWGVATGLQPGAWYDIHDRSDAQAWSLTAERLGYLLAVLSLDATRPEPYLALLAALRLATVAWQWLPIRPWRIAADTGASALRASLQGAAPLAAIAGLNLLLTHANQMLLAGRGEERQLGLYTAALQLATAVQIAQNQLARTAGYRIALAAQEDDGTAWLRRQALIAAAASLALAGPLTLAAPQLLAAIYGHDFIAAAPALRWLCAWTVLLGPGLIISHHLVCRRRHALLVAASAAGGVLAMVLGWFAVPRYGGSGVAASLCLGHGVAIAAQSFAALRRSRT